jgi:putative ABC transport system substrate-binding protein
MSNKVICFALSALLLALSFPAEAQQPKKIPRIGFLSGGSPTGAFVEAFREGLRKLGYVEGQNIEVEYRYAEGKVDRLSELATELVRIKINVIVAVRAPAIRAAKQATAVIPILMLGPGDPIAEGFVASLARPGGNITGLSSFSTELNGKRLELLKEVVPKITRVAVISGQPSHPGLKDAEAAARSLRLQLQPLVMASASDLESIFEAAITGRAEGFILLPGPYTESHRKRLIDLARKNRLPAMYEAREFVHLGGLMSYGVNLADLFRRAATYVDKILKGTKPADLPVQQPTKFEFVINLKAAKQIGLTIPPNVLARADRVIR